MIGPITLTGLKDVNARFIRRVLLLHPGEQFSPGKVEAARQDLTSLGVFSSVQATAATATDASGMLPITFSFVERPQYAVNLGAAYSTDLGFQGSVSWTDRNLFGNAEQLILSANNTQLGGSASKRSGLRCRRHLHQAGLPPPRPAAPARQPRAERIPPRL